MMAGASAGSGAPVRSASMCVHAMPPTKRSSLAALTPARLTWTTTPRSPSPSPARA